MRYVGKGMVDVSMVLVIDKAMVQVMDQEMVDMAMVMAR